MELYTNKDLETFNDNINNITQKTKSAVNETYEPKTAEFKTNMKIVIDFVINKKRKIYGGYAINTLLKHKNKKDAVYSDVDEIGKDVDFYSNDPLQDWVDLCNILHDSGAKEVKGSEAEHGNTYGIWVNQVKYGDVTYVPTEIYHRIPFIEINKMIITHPHFITIDYLRIFTDPIGSYLFRLDTHFKRIQKLLKYYPLIKTSKKLEPVKGNDEVMNTIFEFIVDTDIIFFGFCAYKYYQNQSGSKDLIDIPYYQILTDNYEEDGVKIINLLKKKYSDDIHVEEFNPFFQFYGSNCVIYYKKQPVVHIFKNIGVCYPTHIIESNTLNKSSKTGQVHIGNFTFVLMMSMILSVRHRVIKDKVRMETYQIMTSSLISMRNHYLKENNKTFLDDTPFQEFNVNCIGTSYNVKREFRNKMGARKKDPNWKGAYRIEYDPSRKKRTEKPNFNFDNISGNQIKNVKKFILLNDKNYETSATESTETPATSQ